MVLPYVALKAGLTPVVLPYTTDAATSGQPLVKETRFASVHVSYSGGPTGGVKPKKYSTLSSKPEKFPIGAMRPLAFALNNPGGIAEVPLVRNAWLFG